MSARAPKAIYNLWYDIQKAVPKAILSGIVGDVAHSFGYHLSRHDLPQSDYSVQLALDRMGASDCASALDISLPPDLMKTVTKRLYDAARAGDQRLKGLREFCGTLDGARTFPWDLHAHASEGIGSWDDSHLWHVHLSFYRAFADDYSTLAPIAQVIAGIPTETELDMTPAERSALIKDIVDGVWAKQIANPDSPKSPAPTAAAWLVYGNKKAGQAVTAAQAAVAAVRTSHMVVDAAAVAQDIKQRVIALLGGSS